jgi:hypothetical protein
MCPRIVSTDWDDLICKFDFLPRHVARRMPSHVHARRRRPCCAVPLPFSFTLALGLSLTPLAAEAQPATHVYRIGRLISGNPPAGPDLNLEAFRQGLRDLSYVEGQNLVLESRYAEGSDERLRELAAELVRLPVEVLMAAGTAAIRAAQHATRTIPIVMVGSYDPMMEGFVASLAQPRGHITGLSFLQTELPAKRLELLKEIVPRSMHIAVLWHPVESRTPLLYSLTGAARALELHLHVAELYHADELDSAFAARSDGGIVRPRASAVFRLMTRVNVVGCSTGRSAGLAPLRILSTYVAARR